jgi:hypothetical protein
MSPIVLVGLLVMAIHFLHAGRKRATLPGAEESMTTTIEFITALFYESREMLGIMDQLRYNGFWIIYLPLKPGEASVCVSNVLTGCKFF